MFSGFSPTIITDEIKKSFKEVRKRYIDMKILTTKCLIYRGIKMNINCDFTIIIVTIS